MTQLELSEKFKSQLKILKDEEIQARVKMVLKELLANPQGGETT